MRRSIKIKQLIKPLIFNREARKINLFPLFFSFKCGIELFIYCV